MVRLLEYGRLKVGPGFAMSLLCFLREGIRTSFLANHHRRENRSAARRAKLGRR